MNYLSGPICRPASLCIEDKLDLECEIGLLKAFYQWYALIRGQPHICELRTDDRIDLGYKAGPLKAFLSLLSTTYIFRHLAYR